MAGTSDFLLQRARDRVFTLDIGDEAARRSRENLAYGLARLHWVQEKLGAPPDAAFIGAAHLCPPANERAWAAGLAYGGRLVWSGGSWPARIKPTACGFLVAGLDEAPVPNGFRDRCRALAAENLKLEGIRLAADLEKGNHFAAVYRVAEGAGEVGYTFLAVLHGSGDELKGENPLGPGVYPDQSPRWRRALVKFKSPWGDVPALVGDNAGEYVENCLRVDAFARRRREMLARRLFGRSVVLFNQSHHGPGGLGDFRSGCHLAEGLDAPSTWLPYMAGPGGPSFLIRPSAGCGPWNDPETRERLETAGLVCLTRVPLAPHGGGRSLEPTVDADRAGSRGRAVLHFLERRGMAETIAVLEPVVSFPR